ncbi:hypothetical protein [Fibrella forsythiae]|uniref:Uncharacterized protein n=1 Tax=Fibrella forsythiae TaxID=2817061 RepID=A0ABS3JK42_9BACT|nr:hypothetical protein [Fibrella forsythiae]MBO0949786.1 hypothetical protein [Fibrella forsythiae]
MACYPLLFHSVSTPYSKLIALAFFLLAGPLATPTAFAQTPGLSLTVSNSLSCSQLSATITATSSCTGDVTFTFSGPNNFTLLNTTGVASVTVDGAYSVTAVSAGGLCAFESNVAVNSSLHPDYLPLVDFFKSTRGQEWKNQTGWLSNCDPCSGWYGISCNEGRVSRMSLLFNKLSGPIPPTISRLQALTGLFLPYNEITGTLPVSLSSLSNLSSLWVQDNQLTGPIPERYDRLTRLSVFNVADNRLTGSIPTSLMSLTALTQFWVRSNLLSGPIPTSWHKLINLVSLDLAFNSFASGGIPPDIGQLINLEDLSMAGCHLVGTIPAELNTLSNLRHLYLSSNSLKGTIPSFLGSLSKLEAIVLNNNQFVGAIPPSIGSLPKLITLVVESNDLSGCIPGSFSALCGKDIRLGYNPKLPGGGNWTAFCTNGTGIRNGTVTSVQAGYWHVPSTWSCGVIPKPGDRILVTYPLKMAPDQLNQVQQIQYGATGTLFYEPGAVLVVRP